MSNDRSSNGNAATPRTWFERLSHALLGEPQDREQLVELLRDAEQRSLLDSDALAMIEGVLLTSELRVRDIMIPRAQMAVVERDVALKDSLRTIIDSGHSRFPVVGDNRDEVLGILLAKDLLAFLVDPERVFNIRDVLRPAVFIPESKRLNILLNEFRSNRNHMAIVVDEYGGVSGLVTIEDVIEQIVGEIADEHDIDEATFIKEHGNGQFILKALTPIEEFNEYFKANLSDEEFDTIGGLVMSKFGYLPKPGESVAIDNYKFKVLHADSRRTHLLRMKIAPVAQEEQSAAPRSASGST